MSKIVKFPGDDDESKCGVVVRLVTKVEAETLAAKSKPQKFLGKCWSALVWVFYGLRYVLATAVQVVVVSALCTVGAFRRLITFFCVLCPIVLYFSYGVTYVHTAKAGPPTIYLFGFCFFMLGLSHFAYALSEAVVQQRPAFRLFGIKSNKP